MNPDDKKTALRMIPYGLYVLTAKHDDNTAAATVHWVTQTSFDPPPRRHRGEGRLGRRRGAQGGWALCPQYAGQGPAGRPDEAILEMKELGDNVFYGG